MIGHHPTAPRFFPEDRFRQFSQTTLRDAYNSFKRKDHYREWTDACMGRTETSSPFSYAGPLTETVLLGNVAIRHPDQELTWDAKALQFAKHASATALLQRPYRKRWEIDALSG